MTAHSKPILFSAPMVRAILNSSKVQTRRVVKNAGLYAIDADIHGQETAARELLALATRCPHGTPGDAIWCRETFFAYGRWETRFSQKKGRDEWHFIDMTRECGHPYTYAADAPDFRPNGRVAGYAPAWFKRPAIFMPRVASRITLEITDVRVERLTAISQQDAQAEGAPPAHPSIDRISREFGYPDFPRSWYAQLWDAINGPGAWEANPWVFAISFKVVKP